MLEFKHWEWVCIHPLNWAEQNTTCYILQSLFRIVVRKVDSTRNPPLLVCPPVLACPPPGARLPPPPTLLGMWPRIKPQMLFNATAKFSEKLQKFYIFQNTYHYSVRSFVCMHVKLWHC
jgi:hypothetical protein